MPTDLSTLLRHFDLQGEGRQDLIAAGNIVKKHIDEVLDDFYGFVLSEPDLAQYLPTQAINDRARSAQRKHWLRLLSGQIDEDYERSTDAIGRQHFKIELPVGFYLSGYARVGTFLQQRLFAASGPLLTRSARARLGRQSAAMARAFALDSTLVIDAYYLAKNEELARAMTHLTDGILRTAERDLSTPIPGPETSDFPPRFNDVRVAFNRVMEGTRTVIEAIAGSVESLAQGATEVSIATDEMSQRIVNQAATLEETAAAMEQVTTTLKTSAEATAQTNTVVNDTRDNAEKSGAVVLEAVRKMEEIEESSARIGKIITVIEDIAFQTNLLALNAGVEAARAGESGRGFAVVASEVRALAQRASDSARQINELISESSAHVTAGVALVGSAGTSLTGIVADITSAATLATEIATSSREQSTALGEINLGVSQLDTTTQQNASHVQATSDAAAAMQRDAQRLSELVRSFNLSTRHGEVDEVATFRRAG